MNSSQRAIFFDRDGVVNVRLVSDYVRSVDQMILIPDIVEALRGTEALGFRPILVTNQRGIARGLMSDDDLHEIHRWLQQELSRRAAPGFDAIYYCPHGADDGCECRKPRPGMLLQAAREHGIDLSRSWMIGDSPGDVAAGRAAGCRTAWVGPEGERSGADVHGLTLTEVMRGIAEIEGGGADTGVGSGRHGNTV